MDSRQFVISYYRDAADGMHVQYIRNSTEAQRPHSHTYFQIYYVAVGHLKHFVAEETATLSRGDMFIIPPGVTHHIRVIGDAEFYTLSFMPEIFGEAGACNTMAVHFLRELESAHNNALRPMVTTAPEDTLYMEGLFKQMLHTFHQKQPGSNAVLRAYCNLLVTLLAKTCYETAPSDFLPAMKNNRQAILRGISYIEQNYTDDLTPEVVARYCAMSKSSFATLFSKVAGTSFHRYLNNCRINHACNYIRQGYQITGIYGLCGFRDFSTFYRNFKRVTGLSPEDYKKTQKTNFSVYNTHTL